ncbi:hypothetical protein [Anaerosacchariphilus polymeriproducens]|uniref:Uncharacterized protein n=1 Tax=Anaerosacchariphilus polymeriproducens TaxID=1812858 RepID=A0A371AQZ7_9FIRM|nr:hypothetical protein [Anaerosacchariphilus polymeriproducens]RDU21962.1 hypothetical protein DWV06_15615 [Anaerosacchariphilus polymeriproducens]
MNKDMIRRLQEAKKYEWMAVKALFPESATAHIEVIEKELKEMLMECMLDFLKSNDEKDKSEQKKEAKDVKKVTIG